MNKSTLLKFGKTYFLASLLGVFGVLLSSFAMAETSAAPQQAIETFLQTLQSMEYPVQDQAAHAKLTATANGFLDLDSMGKRALESHLKETSSEQLQEFLGLLEKLIENVAYPRSKKFIGNYKITYPKVEPSGNGYQVHSVIAQAEEALNASVIYHLYEKDGQWKIDDIILDDVSIAEDLKYQFDKIIADSQFSGLLTKMRERLATAEKENGNLN